MCCKLNDPWFLRVSDFSCRNFCNGCLFCFGFSWVSFVSCWKENTIAEVNLLRCSLCNAILFQYCHWAMVFTQQIRLNYECTHTCTLIQSMQMQTVSTARFKIVAPIHINSTFKPFYILCIKFKLRLLVKESSCNYFICWSNICILITITLTFTVSYRFSRLLDCLCGSETTAVIHTGCPSRSCPLCTCPCTFHLTICYWNILYN